MREAWNTLKTCGFLSSTRFRSFFLYIKEPLEELMYGSMIRKPWYLALSASPLFIVMIPMFSFVLIGLAAVDIYQLIKAKDKNLDLWLNAIIGATCAILATTSLTLFEITLLTGIAIPIGPWFFLASVLVFSGNALFQTGLNFWRAYQSQPGSEDRLNHLQTAINWSFILATVASVVGCVLFVILFPNLCVTAGTICASATVAFTTMSLVWRMTPSTIKSRIKQSVGLEKTDSDDVTSASHNHSSILRTAAPSLLKQAETNHDSKLGWCFSSLNRTHSESSKTDCTNDLCPSNR